MLIVYMFIYVYSWLISMGVILINVINARVRLDSLRWENSSPAYLRSWLSVFTEKVPVKCKRNLQTDQPKILLKIKIQFSLKAAS